MPWLSEKPGRRFESIQRKDFDHVAKARFGNAIAHVLTGAWSLLSALAQGDLGGWALTIVQVLGPGIVGLAAVVAATLLTPVPAVLSFRDVLKSPLAGRMTTRATCKQPIRSGGRLKVILPCPNSSRGAVAR